MSPKQEIARFFENFNQQKFSSPSDLTSAIAQLSPPIRKAVTMATDANHITRHEAQVHCNFEAKSLLVLKEYRVDFKNIHQNGLDLREEMTFQNWENFFARLHGPVYDALVREFWKHAEHDDVYIVSHVLGRKIIITEESIGKLLGLDHMEGKRFHVKDTDLRDDMINFLHSELYTDFSLGKEKKEYKVKTLKPKYRAWHKIILGCINPRPPTNSADHINMNQKNMLYCLDRKKKLSLPFIIFYYLKEILYKSRTAGGRQVKKPPMYIPFGRLISDILVESKLVEDLINVGCTKDLTETTDDVLDARNMKNIKAIPTVTVDPASDDPQEIVKRRFHIDGYPIWSKYDDPEAMAWFIYSLELEGHDMSWFTYDDFPDCPPEWLERKKKTKRKRKAEAEELLQMKDSKKPKKEKVIGLQTNSAPSKGNTSDSSSDDDVFSDNIDTSMLSKTPTPSNTQNQKSTQTQSFLSAQETETPSSPSHQNTSDIPDPLTPPTETLPPPTSATLDSEKPSSPHQTSEAAASEATSPKQPTSEPSHTSHTTTSEPPITSSETFIPTSEPIVISPPLSYAENTSSDIILFDPKPQNIIDSINVFGLHAKRWASDLLDSTSLSPRSVKKDWEDYQHLMIDAFRHLHQASEIDKLNCISVAYDRKEVWMHERNVVLAAKQKIVDARESTMVKAAQEAMAAQAEERLLAATAREILLTVQEELQEEVRKREEIQRVREEARQFLVPRVHALLLELAAARTATDPMETESEKEVSQPAAAQPTEFLPQASSSDSRIVSLERAVEKIQETQSDMQKKLEDSQAALLKRMDEQETSSKTMLSMLETLLSRTQQPPPSS